jgi:hypothetical protein
MGEGEDMRKKQEEIKWEEQGGVEWVMGLEVVGCDGWWGGVRERVLGLYRAWYEKRERGLRRGVRELSKYIGV